MRIYDWLICKLLYKTAGIRNKHYLFKFQRVCSIFLGVRGYVITENGSHGYFVKHKGKYEKILPLWFHCYGWWSHASNLAWPPYCLTWTNLHGLAFIFWHHFLAHSIDLGFLEKLSYLSTTTHGQSFGSLYHTMCCHRKTSWLRALVFDHHLYHLQFV